MDLSPRDVKQKRDMNPLPPISRLPAEILLRIMHDVAKFQHNPFVREKQHPWWISITHVCHYWRSLALATPALWNNIDIPVFYSPDASDPFGVSESRENEHLQEWLRRSKEEPLKAHISPAYYSDSDTNYIHSEAATCFIEKYGHRIEELDVLLTVTHLQEIDWPILSKSLRSLAITYTSGEEQTPLPSSFLRFIASSDMNRIAILNFYYMDSFWSVPSLPTALKRLQLESSRSGSASPENSSLEKILAVLEGLPHLESLELTYMLKYLPHSLSSKIVQLRRLRSLSINDDAVQVADLLCHMEFLPASLIEAQMNCVITLESTSEDWSYISHNLSKVHKSSRTSTGSIAPQHAIRSCIIQFDQNESTIEVNFTISCFTEQHPAEDLVCQYYNRRIPGDLDFMFTGFNEPGVSRSKPLFDLCQGVSLQRTEVLALYGGVEDKERNTAWVQFLRNELRNVRVLRLGPFHAEFLAPFPVAYLLHGVHDDNGQDIIFPELSDLYVSDFNDNDNISIRSALCHDLRKALVTRKRVGKGITNLYLEKSWEGDDESHIDCFDGVVNNVLLFNEGSGLLVHDS